MEIWKDVIGFEGLYQVSNLGRIKSVYRNKFLTILPSKDGYIRKLLYKDGKEHPVYIHRLVAEAFIPNPDNLPCVNHKDENKSNNVEENLEWCSYEYNNNYLDKGNRIGVSKGKRVSQYSLSGNFIKEYYSTNEAHRATGVAQGNIVSCCLGDRASAGGFKWKYNPC